MASFIHRNYEQECLNRIRKRLFHNGIISQKDPLEISSEEFFKDRHQYIHPERKFFYGLLATDIPQIENAIRTAQPNSNPDVFPDFIFENGFIEHFQITSSKVGGKGAVQKREEAAFNQTIQEEWEEYLKNEQNELVSKEWQMQYPEHSYTYLTKSFQRSWEHHIDSLDKCSEAGKVHIFLIEYPDMALSMCELLYEGFPNGIQIGDLRVQQSFNNYHLSRDKKMLNYIYAYKDKIDYVIYVSFDVVEIIKLENIPSLLTLLPWKFAFAANHCTLFHNAYPISAFPIQPLEDDNKNKQNNEVQDDHP